MKHRTVTILLGGVGQGLGDALDFFFRIAIVLGSLLAGSITAFLLVQYAGVRWRWWLIPACAGYWGLLVLLVLKIKMSLLMN